MESNQVKAFELFVDSIKVFPPAEIVAKIDDFIWRIGQKDFLNVEEANILSKVIRKRFDDGRFLLERNLFLSNLARKVLSCGYGRFNRKFATALMTLDDFDRQKPKLLGFEEFKSIFNKTHTSEARAGGLVEDGCFYKPSRSRHADTVNSNFEMSAIVAELISSHRILEVILREGNGHIVVAGDAVLRAILAKFGFRQSMKLEIVKCRLYFVGVDEEEALQLLEKVVTACVAEFGPMEFLRSTTSLQMNVISERGFGDHSYILCLETFKSIEDLICHFDVSCKGIGYCPEKGIFMSFMAAVSISTQTIIVDPSKRNDGFESWLELYYEAGFGLMFPSLKFSSNLGESFSDNFENQVFLLLFIIYYHF